MENEKNRTAIQKTQVFNVVILDRSGSMEAIRKAAIDGFNETLAGIRKAQEKYADTQDHYVTLVTFCSCSTQYVFDKTPIADTHPLTENDYQPCCCTPLFDAMGITLTAMRRHVKDMDDAVVMVTIITDGMENASCEYNGASIKALVEQLRQEGWSFTYMGANQDAVEVAISLSIRNARNFDYTNEGTRQSMGRDSSTRMNFFDRLNVMKQSEACGAMAPMDANERRQCYTTMADEAFDEVESQE